MLRIAFGICIFMTSLAVTKPEEPPSLAPSLSCSTIIYDMADCLSFLSNGSTEEKPTSSCCSGFKAVLKSNAECICEALKSSAELGIDLNLTKAATLPSACKVSAPPISKCDVSSSPGASPANPPSPNSPEVPAVPGPSNSPVPPTASEEVSVHAPAPALSGTYSLSACLFVFISMLVISFSCISAV
ncbi:hypothetical protein DITRI_Ditri03aG0160100 [Diplodiscus trichospermus]